MLKNLITLLITGLILYVIYLIVAMLVQGLILTVVGIILLLVFLWKVAEVFEVKL